LAVLQKIKALGLTTAILSNGSVDMLTSAVASAGMEDVLDHVISVDPIRLFKTSPESYGLVQKFIPVCSRRLKTEPPCRLKFEPGAEADFEMVGCG